MAKHDPACVLLQKKKIFNGFLDRLEIEQGASPYTLRNYRQSLDEFWSFCLKEFQKKPIWEELTHDLFRAYLRFLGGEGLSRASIQGRFSALRTFFRFLIQQGKIDHSPLKALKIPQGGTRLPKFLTIDQMAALLNAPLVEWKSLEGKRTRRDISLFLRDQAILETLYGGGLRISELCALTWEDILWEDSAIKVRGKGKRERLAPVGEEALEGYQKLLGAP